MALPTQIDQFGQALNFPGFDFGGIAQAVGIGILLIAIIGLIIVFKKKNPIKSYPTTVLVHEILKDGKPYPYLTKGRRVGKYSEFQEYELKNGDKTQAFSFRDLSVLPNGKKFLELDKLEDGRYIPHKSNFKGTIQKTTKVMVPNPMDPKKMVEKDLEYAVNLYDLEANQDDVNHTIEQIRRDIKQFSATGFWNKYGFQIIVVMAIFANAMLTYVAIQYGVIPINNQGGEIARQNAITMERFENVTTQWFEYQTRLSQERQHELVLFARFLNVSLDGINGTVIT